MKSRYINTVRPTAFIRCVFPDLRVTEDPETHHVWEAQVYFLLQAIALFQVAYVSKEAIRTFAAMLFVKVYHTVKIPSSLTTMLGTYEHSEQETRP